MSRHKHRTGFRWRSLYQWHRVIGLTAALFVLLLAVTGIALNHTGQFDLDKRYVTSAALLDWYGITQPTPVSFQAGSYRITQIGERLYFDGAEIAAHEQELLGAVVINDTIVAGVEGELILLTADGKVLETLAGAQGVPAGMRALGVGEIGQIVLRAAHGDYTVDLDDLNWSESAELPAVWSQASALPSGLAVTLSDAYRGSGLSAERVILDLHSGRIVGEWGIYVMDGAAILLIALSISGFILWLNQKRKERAHHRSQRH